MSELIITEKDTNEAKIAILLKKLGIPTCCRGWQYVFDAVKMAYLDASYLDGLTKRLYKDIAVNHKTTSSRVERGIRYAIEEGILRAPISAYSKAFGNMLSSEKGKPTNGEFIATLAGLLKYEPDNPLFTYSE